MGSFTATFTAYTSGLTGLTAYAYGGGSTLTGGTVTESPAASGVYLSTFTGTAANTVYACKLKDAGGATHSTGAVRTDANGDDAELLTDAIKVAVDSIEEAVEELAGQQGGGGNGDVVVNHNYGGTDALRVLDSDSQPADNVLIRAYVKADYDAGTIDPNPPSAYTGSDGRWTRPLNLDPDTYTVTYYSEQTKIDYETTLVVA